MVGPVGRRGFARLIGWDHGFHRSRFAKYVDNALALIVRVAVALPAAMGTGW